MRAEILITSYWLHVELEKNILKIYFLTYNFFKLLLVFYVVLQPRRYNFSIFLKYTLYIMFYKMYANAK
jgi:hypothetical protein